MRRRLRSAAFPLHRHSLLQLAIDGALVAAAYYLSYRLRFDAGVPEKYDRLFEATIAWVVLAALVVFTLLRLEVKQWRYTGHRDYLAVVEAVAVNTLVPAGFIAIVHPVTIPSRTGAVAVTAPTGVLALFFLLTLALVGGARFVARIAYEGPLRGIPPRARAPRGLIVGRGGGRRAPPGRAPAPGGSSSWAPARAGGSSCARSCATRSSTSTPSASSTTTRSSAASASRASACSAAPRSSGASSTRPSPTSSSSRSRRRRARCARTSCARRAGAGSGCARCRPSSSCCSPDRGRSSARCATCRSRTSSAASRCGWSSSASART